jgi:hypothetical protein
MRQELAKPTWRISTALIVFSGLMSGWADRVVGAREVENPPVPDFTQGGKKGDSHDWLLGPTGARGWMFFRHEDLTAASRQILITAVEAGSPADGILRTKEVLPQLREMSRRAGGRKRSSTSSLPTSKRPRIRQRWRI